MDTKVSHGLRMAGQVHRTRQSKVRSDVLHNNRIYSQAQPELELGPPKTGDKVTGLSGQSLNAAPGSRAQGVGRVPR